MTQREFNKEIREILERHVRRVVKLRKVLEGDVKLKRVLVKKYRVRSYTVKSHYRYV